MQNPKTIPTRTTGEKEISSARHQHFRELFSDYANVLGGFAGSVNATDPFALINKLVGTFLYQVVYARTHAEADQKAKHHFHEFAASMLKREDKALIHADDVEKFNHEYYLSVKAYEQARVTVLFNDLTREKAIDPMMDEVLFWVDFFEALKAELPGVADHIDYLFNRQRLELVFHRIERGVRYDG